MTQGQQSYELWFGNNSTKPGQCCVYQNKTNTTANVQASQLAWMVSGANTSTWVQFIWTLDYSFVYIDQGPPRSQQILAADLTASNSTVLSHNQFGYSLSEPSTGSPGLSIKEDGSIPVVNNAVAGIGMGSAGTFAVAASPNQTLFFTPAETSNLSYFITFGDYTFQVGEVLAVKALSNPGTVKFSPGSFAMTATLDSSNIWTITTGRPPGFSTLDDVMIYQAGKGGSH